MTAKRRPTSARTHTSAVTASTRRPPKPPVVAQSVRTTTRSRRRRSSTATTLIQAQPFISATCFPVFLWKRGQVNRYWSSQVGSHSIAGGSQLCV